MAKYSLLIKRSARKELESIATKAERRRFIARIQSLADDPKPPGAMKLSGLEHYRYRRGRFRILYTIEDAALIVQVIKLGERKDA